MGLNTPNNRNRTPLYTPDPESSNLTGGGTPGGGATGGAGGAGGNTGLDTTGLAETTERLTRGAGGGNRQSVHGDYSFGDYSSPEYQDQSTTSGGPAGPPPTSGGSGGAPNPPQPGPTSTPQPGGGNDPRYPQPTTHTNAPVGGQSYSNATYNDWQPDPGAAQRWYDEER